jgi:polysaccharide biosynthesis transport protein
MLILRTKTLGFTLLLAGLALCGTGLGLLLSPAQYQATTKIKLETDGPDVNGQVSYDAYFIQTELEIIQSPLVLSNVVESLNLNVVWGKKYGNGNPFKTVKSIKRLHSRIKLEPVRNTILLEISFSDHDPNEAAGIANAIAKAYSDYRMERWRQLTIGGIKMLEEKYQKEKEQIQVVQTNVDLQRRNSTIQNDDLLSHTPFNYFSNMPPEQAVGELQMQLAELRKYDTNKLQDILPTVVSDGVLTDLLDKLHEAQQIIVLVSGDNPMNPAILIVQVRIDKLQRQINDRTSLIMAGFENELKEKQVDMEAGKNYLDLNHKLEQVIKLHKLLATKIEALKLNVQIPKISLVEIVDAAKPPKLPVSPNRWLGATLMAIGGFQTVGGFLLLKSSRRYSRT